MLAPLVSTYYDRQVKPVFVQALGSTKTIIDRLDPNGYDQERVVNQLRDVSQKLDQAENMSLMALQMGTDLNKPAQQSIDRLAATVQRFPDGAQAAAQLKALSNLIDQRRVAQEIFK